MSIEDQPAQNVGEWSVYFDDSNSATQEVTGHDLQSAQQEDIHKSLKAAERPSVLGTVDEIAVEETLAGNDMTRAVVLVLVPV